MSKLPQPVELTEESLDATLQELRKGFTIRPTSIHITPEGLELMRGRAEHLGIKEARTMDVLQLYAELLRKASATSTRAGGGNG